jgi:hypothetical protein
LLSKEIKAKERSSGYSMLQKLRTITDLFRKANPVSREKGKAGLQAEV